MLANNQIIRSRTTLISLSVYTTFTTGLAKSNTGEHTWGRILDWLHNKQGVEH